MKLAGEIRSSGVVVTLVVHEHKRLGRGIELAVLAEELKASDVGLEFLTGELKGSHDPSGIVFTVLAAMSGMGREYIRDRTLEGHESTRKRGKTIGGAGGTDADMLAMALHLRDQEMSLRNMRDADILLFTTGGSSVDPLTWTPEFGSIAVATAALRAYVLLASSGGYAAHVPIFTWTGSGDPPEPQADIIAERYWDICTKREGAERPNDIRRPAAEAMRGAGAPRAARTAPAPSTAAGLRESVRADGEVESRRDGRESLVDQLVHIDSAAAL